jgi:hypothetical protein
LRVYISPSFIIYQQKNRTKRQGIDRWRRYWIPIIIQFEKNCQFRKWPINFPRDLFPLDTHTPHIRIGFVLSTFIVLKWVNFSPCFLPPFQKLLSNVVGCWVGKRKNKKKLDLNKIKKYFPLSSLIPRFSISNLIYILWQIFLFIFPGTPWMKVMKIFLDIIFLNDQKRLNSYEKKSALASKCIHIFINEITFEIACSLKCLTSLNCPINEASHSIVTMIRNPRVRMWWWKSSKSKNHIYLATSMCVVVFIWMMIYKIMRKNKRKTCHLQWRLSSAIRIRPANVGGRWEIASILDYYYEYFSPLSVRLYST